MKRQGFKKLRITIGILLLLCFSVCFSACSTFGKGKSAYEIAVENGFVGTEVDWLNSLKGEDAQKTDIEDIYLSAKNNGFKGEFLDFLKEYLAFEDSSDLVYASNKALRSVVAVVAKHTGTQITYIPFVGYQEEKVEFSSSGSGVILSLDKNKGDAYIVTNYHVVYSSNSDTSDKISDDVTVSIYGQSAENIISAQYVGGSMNYDIAVLKVTNSLVLSLSDCVEAEVADSNDLVVGQGVVAVGNAEGLGISVTKGIVSVPSEYIAMTASDGRTAIELRVVRIDAGINAGNSGGGLFDQNGKLIGVVNAKMVDEEIEAMGYAIPSSVAIAVANQIILNGSVKICDIGISYEGTNAFASFNTDLQVYETKESVTVTEVTFGGPSSLKIKKNDVITAIGFLGGQLQELNHAYQLTDFLLNCKAGDTVVVVLTRADEQLEVKISVGAGDIKTVA